ncbi:hypothetical protein ACFYY2_31505 [Streptomyces sp. NPDC001822]|uniref:hypothetical protein n=1 Tax=Streptomyces sp. NPDC001822 TaxID=3364614 RepID=UPI0036AD6883
MIETLVSNNDRDRYPAHVDPAEVNEEGYVLPWFDLETVRRIAEGTQDDAADFSYGSIDTVHVIDGGYERGETRALVVIVTWMYMPEKSAEEATEILAPHRETGLYAVGGLPWCWYALDDDLSLNFPFRAK